MEKKKKTIEQLRIAAQRSDPDARKLLNIETKRVLNLSGEIEDAIQKIKNNDYYNMDYHKIDTKVSDYVAGLMTIHEENLEDGDFLEDGDGAQDWIPERANNLMEYRGGHYQRKMEEYIEDRVSENMSIKDIDRIKSEAYQDAYNEAYAQAENDYFRHKERRRQAYLDEMRREEYNIQWRLTERLAENYTKLLNSAIQHLENGLIEDAEHLLQEAQDLSQENPHGYLFSVQDIDRPSYIVDLTSIREKQERRKADIEYLSNYRLDID